MAELVPVDHDPFAAQALPPETPGVTRITVTPGRQPQMIPVDHDPFAGGMADTALDVAKSAGVGVARGTIGPAGFGGDVGRLISSGIQKGADWVASATGAQQQPGMGEAVTGALRFSPIGALLGGPTSQAIQGAIEQYTGKFYEPKTTLGRYTRTVGEFLPGAVVGPGGVFRNAVNFAVAPGIVSEAAGQMAEGTALEPWARAGTALATGGVAALVNRPGNVGQQIARNTQGATDAQLQAAEDLFQQAQQAGVPITRPEAIQYVTGGATNMGNLQRVVEGQGGLQEFMGARPQQVEAAARPAFDAVVPPNVAPSGIGPAVQRGAEGTVNDMRGDINWLTRPDYQAATAQRINPQTFAQIRNDPVFQEGLRRVRNDPWIGPTLQGLPDDSVAVVDAIKKQLDETGRNLRDPLSGTARNNYSASIVEQGRDRAVVAADRATGSAPAPQRAVGTYEAARNTQEDLRRRFLQPLLDGPLGTLAKQDTTTQGAIEALFPRNPLPNSADEITTAVGALTQRNARAARDLVRAHLESVFNQATRNLQGGPNQFGGAGFAAAVRGNSQQAANLEAAIRALPNGDQTWVGIDRFLTFLEAQGTRQRIGSQTSFNTEMQKELSRGGPIGDAMTVVAGAGMQLPSRIQKMVERWRLGGNVNELARLMTDPQAGRMFRQMASQPVGSREAGVAFLRLMAMTRTAASQSSDKR